MSTLPTPSTFPLDAWYAAGWDVDIGRTLLPRTVCGQPMVFYRRFDRVAVALEDACWHRLMPLSKGQLQGDQVVCAYHGLSFDAAGRCTHVPGQDKPPTRAAVRAYPVIEKHRMVWVWPGDPSLADPALVPDLHWADDPEWASEGAHFEMACDYRLVLDNLMDLTHETFVHKSSIGHDAVANTPLKVSHEGRRVRVERWMHDVDAPPFLDMQLRMARGFEKSPNVDRWQIIHFEAPNTIVIDVGVAPTGTGAPQGDRSAGISGRVMNTVTPKGDGSCYYFFAYGRCFALDNRNLTADIRAANIRIFTEDNVVLEEQQRMMDQLPGRKLVDLGIDAGSLWSRRAIAAMIEEERTRAEARRDEATGVAA